MGTLFFIGDSITTGAWDERGGWTNRLIGKIMDHTIQADFKENGFYCLPYNLGVSGDTVADVLNRLEREVSARIDPGEAVQFVYAIGINDSLYQDGEVLFTDEAFKKNLEKLITQSRQFTQNISFIGLTPADDALLNPIPWAPDKAYKNERVKYFESILADKCKKEELPFLPLNEVWQKRSDWKDQLIDGVHPNSKGHALLAEQIGEFLLTETFYTFHIAS